MKTLRLALAGIACWTLLVLLPGRAPAQVVQQPTPAQQFVLLQANTDYAEIQLGQLALKNAQSDAVKKFAQIMVDNHEKCRKDLLDHFKDLKIGVISAMAKQDKELYDDLAKRKGADFDRAYMDAQVKRHQQLLEFLQVNTKSTDALVKSFAEKELKAVQGHLKRAQEIQKDLK
jgi:putative membrane protein